MIYVKVAPKKSKSDVSVWMLSHGLIIQLYPHLGGFGTTLLLSMGLCRIPLLDPPMQIINKRTPHEVCGGRWLFIHHIAKK